MKIKPLTDKVLIKPKSSEEKTSGGIYIPDSAKEKTQEGTVIGVGKNKDGKDLPLKEGDKVIFESYGGTEIKINNEKHLVMDIKDILAVIE